MQELFLLKEKGGRERGKEGRRERRKGRMKEWRGGGKEKLMYQKFQVQ